MRTYSNRPQISAHAADTKPLTENELRVAAHRVYPDFTVEKVWLVAPRQHAGRHLDEPRPAPATKN